MDLTVPSGIATYSATRLFVDRKTSEPYSDDGHDDDADVVKAPDDGSIKPERSVRVISDVVVKLPSASVDSEQRSEKGNAVAVEQTTTTQQQPIEEKTSATTSSAAPTEPKTEPKAKVPNRRVVYIEEGSQDPTVHYAARNMIFAKPKSTIKPKSRLKGATQTKEPQDPMTVVHLNSSQDSGVASKMKPKPRIGPRSAMVAWEANREPAAPEHLIENLMLSSTQQLIEDLTHSQPLMAPPPTPPQRLNLSKSLPLPNPNPSDIRPPKSPVKQPNVSASDATVPVRDGENVAAEPLTPSSASNLKSINDFVQSFEAAQRRLEALKCKYIEETDPAALSLKHFFDRFYDAEFETDSGCAETQLNNSEMGPHTPSISNENHFDADGHSVVNLSPNRILAGSPKSVTEPASSPQTVLRQNELHGEPQTECIGTPRKIKVEPEDESSTKRGKEPQSPSVFVVQQLNAEADDSSDAIVVELPADEPIEISMSDTQDLIENMQIENSGELPSVAPFTIPQQSVVSCDKKKSPSG